MLIPSILNPPHGLSDKALASSRSPSEELSLRRRYFLEVELEIMANKKKDFTREGQNFLASFRASNLDLVASAWRTDVGPIVAVNYWDMGNDANNLLEAELSLPDIPGFNDFNALVEREIKSIVVPLAGEESRAIPKSVFGQLDRQEYSYLRVVSVVPTKTFPEFAARVEGYLGAFTEFHDLYLGDTYLSITGTEGRVSQMWIVQNSKLPNIPDLLDEAAWLQDDVLLETRPAFQILRATQSDPNFAPTVSIAAEEEALPEVVSI